MSSGRGHSTDRTRVPGQNVRISRSDRWIALKFFHEFSKAVLDGVAWNRVRHADAVRSGPFRRQHQSIGSKGPISRSDHGSRSNFFHEFPEAGLDGVAWNRYGTPMLSNQGHSTHRTRERGPKRPYLEIRPLHRAQMFSRVFEGCFRWSSVESVRHADAVRSGPFHRQ